MTTLDNIINQILNDSSFNTVFDYPPFLRVSTAIQAKDLFLGLTQNIGLKKTVNHEFISQLILTTKLRIDSLVPPESYIAMGILSAIIDNIPLKDTSMKDKKNYTAYRGPISAEFMRGENFQGGEPMSYNCFDFTEAYGVKNDTYLFNLSEMLLIIKDFQNGHSLKLSDDFLIYSVDVFTQFIEKSKISTQTLNEFTEHPKYLKGINKKILAEKKEEAHL